MMFIECKQGLRFFLICVISDERYSMFASLAIQICLHCGLVVTMIARPELAHFFLSVA